MVELSFRSLAANFEETTGDAVLSCRLTVTGQAGHSAAAIVEDVKVSITNKPGTEDPGDKPGTEDRDDPGITEVEVKEVSISEKNLILSVGEIIQLKEAVAPENATDKTLAYHTSNSNAEVSDTGLATAKKVGASTIQIKVKLPKGTASRKVTYTSSNKKLASVSSAGKVTAKRKGSAAIKVKTFNGKKARLKITVKQAD